MQALDLKSKWDKVSAGGVHGSYKSLRISAVCFAELFLAMSTDGNRCLILALPAVSKLSFNGVTKAKLSIELATTSNYLILTLRDADFDSLFDDLIISLYNSIKDIEDMDTYTNVFVQTFYQWSAFFEDGQSERLSRDIIQGLFGELFVLKTLLEKGEPAQVNDILDAWKGPYDQGHDFIRDDRHIEVKTKLATKNNIRITSENQLASSQGEELELVVLSVIHDPVNGMALKELFDEVKLLVIERLGDPRLLYQAMLQKGITGSNIHLYDNYRFMPICLAVYDCMKAAFPKLVKSALPAAINSVKYDINLAGLSEFLISEVEF